MSFFISLYKTKLYIVLISIRFYSIISKRKRKTELERSANGNDFNDYGNTYAYKNIVFDYIMMNDDDCIIDG